MNPKLRLLLQLLLVAVVAALSSWIAGRFLWDRPGHDVVSAHYLMHDALNLTSEQERTLHEVEAHYEARWKSLVSEIAEANRDLASSLRRDEGYSPQVAAAVERIAGAQAGLQQVTLEHVFAMKPHLTAEQYNRLLQLCADSLEEK